MRKLVYILILLIGCYGAFADTAADQFRKANTAYAAKDFTKARELYQALADSGYQSSELYYNLGNAWYKEGAVAEAIWYLEKARKLDPGNEDVNFNLKIANLRVADKIEAAPELMLLKKTKDFFGARSSGRWGMWAIILLWVALVSAVVFLFTRHGLVKRISFFGGLLLLVLSFAAAGIAWGRYEAEINSRYAIVFATNTYVKSAPDLQSVDLFILREGVKVQLLDLSGDWQKVKVPDAKGDKVGWIPKEQVKAI
jgi:tetratricopeptide (TPR) repeat protein